MTLNIYHLKNLDRNKRLWPSGSLSQKAPDSNYRIIWYRFDAQVRILQDAHVFLSGISPAGKAFWMLLSS